jgi:hypothetical protein
MRDWEMVASAVRLCEIGRFEEALGLAQSAGIHELAEIIRFRSREDISPRMPVLMGWQFYYSGRYSEALENFYQSSGGGWIESWAFLGVAKVASDCGYWSSALHWCAKAWRTAVEAEHTDMLAEVAGARGEILLRAGRPLEAAESFGVDLALLPPGSRFLGRVRCTEAHAFSRLGPAGRHAAMLGYRLAMHSPGEPATKHYAAAGMALLAARVESPDLLSEVVEPSHSGLPRFWVLVARARLAENPAERGQFVSMAREALPPFYFAEHWWLGGWSGLSPDGGTPGPLDLGGISLPGGDPWNSVEMPVDPESVSDAPWLASNRKGYAPEAWWALRDRFMP